MNTTENEISNVPVEKKEDITSADAKKMKDEYIQGSTIDELAEAYGYESIAVAESVVAEVPDQGDLPTQESIDAQDSKTTKKAK